MITFESRQKVIRNADLITRKAHSLYPHVSESRIVSMIGEDKVKDLFFSIKVKIPKKRKCSIATTFR